MSLLTVHETLLDTHAHTHTHNIYIGDGISLLTVHEALLDLPTNLRNDVVARWSIEEVLNLLALLVQQATRPSTSFTSTKVQKLAQRRSCTLEHRRGTQFYWLY